MELQEQVVKLNSALADDAKKSNGNFTCRITQLETENSDKLCCSFSFISTQGIILISIAVIVLMKLK